MTGFQSPNYTQVPNDLFDDLMEDMSFAELKVVLAIVRQTIGYHRNKTKYSIAKLEKMTGLTRNSVKAGAEQAENRGLIVRTNPQEQGSAEWELVFTPSEDTPPTPQEMTPSPSDTTPQLGLKKDKETSKKTPPSWGIGWAIHSGVDVTDEHFQSDDERFQALAVESADEICHGAEHLRDLAMTFMISARKLPQKGKAGYWRKALQQFVDHKPFPVTPRQVQEAVRQARRDKLTIYTPDSVYKKAGDLSDQKWCPEADPEGAGNWAGRDEKWRQLV